MYLRDPGPDMRGTEEVVRDVAKASTGPSVATFVAQLLDGPPDTRAVGVLGEGELHPGGGTGGDRSPP